MNSMGGLCQSGRKPGKPLPEKEAVDYYEAEAVTEWRNEDQNKLAFRNTLNYLTCDADAEISDPAVHHEGRKVFLRGIVVEGGGQAFLINLKSYTSKKKTFQGVDQVQHSVQC